MHMIYIRFVDLQKTVTLILNLIIMDVIERKEIVHEDYNKEYASKGVAGSALGLIF